MSAEAAPWRRQSSQISGGGSPSPGPGSPAGDGVTAPVPPPPPPPSFPAPAPPPPPPPSTGALPSVRLSTEIPESRGRGSTYEPPAAIQNAMMTKDKKPFTYTPGGLDLSQIRSPRMQRRITRNANAEGVPEQPAQPKASPLAQGQLPPSALAAMQPQLPVAVFPTGGQQMSPPVPPPQPQKSPALSPQPQKSPALSPQPQKSPALSPQPQKVPAPPPQPQQAQAPLPQQQKVTPAPQPQEQRAPNLAHPQAQPQSMNEPGSIYVPPVVQPHSGRAQVGSIYIPPIQQQEQDQQRTASPLSPVSLNKAPTPWMTQRPQQQQVPAWVNREDPPSQRQGPTTTAPAGTRIIPIHVEGRDPPPQVNKTTPPVTPQQQNTRIIPIQLEGEPPVNQPKQPPHHIQQRQPVYVHNKFSPASPSPTSPTPYSPGATENVVEHNPRQLQQQQSWGPPGANGAPIQSRSFRVLQKITDTDNTDTGGETSQQPEYYGNQSTHGVPVQELRKLQLSEDDRALMNKFKAQVDEDSFLHNESDPRYRGPAIPSRAFRMLQSMTDGGSGSDFVPPAVGPARGPQARPQSVQPATESPQPYVPPSEQQVQEPKKYTGGCIPSRSFRMLQAMTAPENCGPGQSDM